MLPFFVSSARAGQSSTDERRVDWKIGYFVFFGMLLMLLLSPVGWLLLLPFPFKLFPPIVIVALMILFWAMGTFDSVPGDEYGDTRQILVDTLADLKGVIQIFEEPYVIVALLITGFVSYAAFSYSVLAGIITLYYGRLVVVGVAMTIDEGPI